MTKLNEKIEFGTPSKKRPQVLVIGFATFVVLATVFLSVWLFKSSQTLSDTSVNGAQNSTSQVIEPKTSKKTDNEFDASIFSESSNSDQCIDNLEEAYRNPETAYQLLRAAKCEAGLYSSSRNQYFADLETAQSRSLKDEIIGYIVATYYGEGDYRGGLVFLSNVYRDIPQGDHRFRFQAHALLRAIAVSEDWSASQSLAVSLRNETGREDFSEVWSVIPLGIMEDLEKRRIRVPFQQYKYAKRGQIQAQDELIARSESGDLIPFIDHLYWARGEYGRAIALDEYSYIHYVALAERAIHGREDTPSERLEDFLRAFPNAPIRNTLTTYALRDQRYAIDHDFWAERVEHYKLATTLDEIRDAEREAKAVIKEALLRNGYDDAMSIMAVVRPELERLAEQREAFMPDSFERSRIEGIPDVAAIRYDGETFGRAMQSVAYEQSNDIKRYVRSYNFREFDAFIEDLRIYYSDIDETTYEEVFERALELREDWTRREIYSDLLGIVATKSSSDNLKGKALYLMGRTSLSGYFANKKSSSDYFKELVDTLPEHDLADDALAETGWILRNRSKHAEAIEVFDQVIASYSDRNAYDNALWLKANSLEDLGRPFAAQLQYAKIAVNESGERLKSVVQSYFKPNISEALGKLNTMAEGVNIDLEEFNIYGVDCSGGETLDIQEVGVETLFVPSTTGSCKIGFLSSQVTSEIGLRWRNARLCQSQWQSGDPLNVGSCEALILDKDQKDAYVRSQSMSGGRVERASRSTGSGYYQSAIVYVNENIATEGNAVQIVSMCNQPVSGSIGFMKDIKPGQGCVISFGYLDEYVSTYRLNESDVATVCEISIRDDSIVLQENCVLRRRKSIASP